MASLKRWVKFFLLSQAPLAVSAGEGQGGKGLLALCLCWGSERESELVKGRTGVGDGLWPESVITEAGQTGNQYLFGPTGSQAVPRRQESGALMRGRAFHPDGEKRGDKRTRNPAGNRDEAL